MEGHVIRQAVRNKLLTDLNIETYEPSIPDKATQKPFIIMIQKDETKNNNATLTTRDFELWVYVDRLTLQNVDELVSKINLCLDLKVCENSNSGLKYTCNVLDIAGDGFDEEWNSFFKCINLRVIALNSIEIEDEWTKALCNFTESFFIGKTYSESFLQDFQVPCILWRTESEDASQLNLKLYKTTKVIKGHIVSKSDPEKFKIANDILFNLKQAIPKIPLNLENRRYLTIDKISNSYNADMFSEGQITLQLSRVDPKIEPEYPLITGIISKGDLKY